MYLNYVLPVLLLGQALGCTREMLHQNNFGDNRPDTLAPRDDNTDDVVFDVDPINSP